ncbi:UbiH/UbiF family hydroxylase [Neorhizobium sp. P12A]|uniref:UbiH/UbiF family hydroxylase n=1 Tax=Neorhizobium sp. P12A TaxID=2268027 RepID=UPI0011ED75CD|nr:UbiH/UbiF family hydroxylase [Neorhizobium sp. P12A]KAA0694486.1 UbiH/UbiF family hydroxylase [Neorhizobium sp. P12A]
MKQIEVAVIGAGLAGSIAAIALARGGRQVVLIAAAPAKTDRRTTALMDQSIRFLERLALWEKIAPSATSLDTMQIIDGTKRLLRAPTVAFRASEIGLESFGYNIPNAALTQVLNDAIKAEGNISTIEASATDIETKQDGVTITLDNGETVEASFVVGADGRRSIVRDSAGIKFRNWSYPQSAMVLNFAHSLPHQNISTEFHTESGPFTQVPLPGSRSSLVWVQKPTEAAARAELTLEELSRHVEERMQSMLGKVTVEDSVQVWPLSGMTAYRFGKGRAALIGEAAHVFPPIGAQGLNLSLRDVMGLVDILCGRASQPVAADAGDSFDRKRRTDIISRTASVDLLNRSLLSDFLPVQMLRAAGLHVLSAIPPLRSIVMREGIEPGGGFRLMPSALREKLRR